MPKIAAARILWCILVLAGGVVARGHESYLVLKALPGGVLEIEAGFSTNESPQGLAVTLRNRENGAVIAEHKLPGDGFLSVPRPKTPYRVEFDAGPGHRISKVGPLHEEGALEPEKAAPANAAASAAPQTSMEMPATPNAAAAPSGGETQRMLWVAGIFFLFGTGAFALGYGAGRASR